MSTENFTDPSFEGEQPSSRKMFDISREQRTEVRFNVNKIVGNDFFFS